MRIVIDLQAAQTSGSRNRGIGRYSISLAKAIVRNAGVHEVHLALNGAFADTLQPIRDEFDDLLPQDRIHVWQGIGPLNQIDPANTRRRLAAEECRLAFLESLRPDVVHIASLFEGLTDDAVGSVEPGQYATSITLYDLIPFLNAKPYLENPTVANWYHNKLGHLRRADLLLSISESSRQEALDALGFDPDGVVNVGTAADDHFRARKVSAARKSELQSLYGIDRPFIMYTGGIDVRKNIEALIEAYSRLPSAVKSKAQLAIVCSVQQAERERLQDLAKSFGVRDLIMTGFVPEEDLIDLYNVCDLFIFPSWHEGFGLPALEAMWCDAPVIGANRSSIPEVIGLQSALFDPHSVKEMSEAIKRGLSDPAFRKKLVESARKQRDKFSWDLSGKRAVSAFEKLHSERQSRAFCKSDHQRLKLACVSPIPPAKSGIADYVVELLPDLARFYDITMVVSDAEKAAASEDPHVNGSLQIIDLDEFESNSGRFDRVLYQIGNSDHHHHMFDMALEYPGVAVLHDFYLSGILHYMQNHLGFDGHWERELFNAHGYSALLAAQNLDAESAIYQFPASLAMLQDFVGVIVHSEFARRLATSWGYGRLAEHWSVISHSRRSQIGGDLVDVHSLHDGFAICSFGIMGRTKANDRLVRCWSKSKFAKDAHSRLIFVGSKDGGKFGEEVDKLIKELGLEKRVVITGWTDSEEFKSYLQRADAAVQLRTLSRGESSGTILDCLAHGVPTIVNANGSMAELDPESVVMLPDEFEDAELIEALDRLHDEPDLRRRLTMAGPKAIAEKHNPRRCADKYAQAIESAYARSRTNPQLLARRVNSIPGPSFSAADRTSLALAISRATRSTARHVAYLDVTDQLMSSGDRFQNPAANHQLKRLLEIDSVIRVEPIRWSVEDGVWLFARAAVSALLSIDLGGLQDEPVPFVHGGDLLVMDAAMANATPVTSARAEYALRISKLTPRAKQSPRGLDADGVVALLARAGWTAEHHDYSPELGEQN